MLGNRYNARICAGIVTYNPDLELLKNNISSLLPQVDEVIVFDNGSKNSGDLLKLLDNFGIDDVILYKVNVGIATALNRLCEDATSKSFEWILTMDQDSICDSKMLYNLTKYLNSDVGIVAPRVEFWSDKSLIYATRMDQEAVSEIEACITSGSLTNLNAWKQIGGFNDWMFIDRVDNEFCIRLKINLFNILRVHSAVLFQRAGEMKFLKLPFGKKVLLPYYSEFRNYYICRNNTYIIRKYHEFINVKHELACFIYSQMIKLLFEGNRIKTIRSTFKGIKDGLQANI